MDNDVVIKYRDKLRAVDKNIALRLTCDNMIVIDEGKNAFVKWNDEGGYLTAAMLNRDAMNRPLEPIEVIMTGYDNIQYMTVRADKDSAPALLKALDYTDKQIKNIVEHFIPSRRYFINMIPEDVAKAKEDYLAKQKQQRDTNLANEESQLAKEGLDSITHKVYGK